MEGIIDWVGENEGKDDGIVEIDGLKETDGCDEGPREGPDD